MPATHMETSRTPDVINLVLAVCLFLSPWVIGFTGDATPAWNAWIIAIALAVVAVAAISAFAEWEEWVNLALGVWLILSPWLLGFAGNMNARWTHIILGVLAVIASAYALWDYRRSPPATI